MSLRKKTLILILFAVFGLISLLYAVSNWILLNSFAELETERMQANVEIVSNVLADDVDTLSSKVGDWAVWDDTYRFVADHNQDYIDSNLPDTTFSELQLDIMIFVDSKAKIVFAKGFDRVAEREVQVPADLLSRIRAGDVLVDHQIAEHHVKGFLTVAGRPMLIVARPILTSEGEGPSHGTLIGGYYLDSAKLASITKKTRLNVSLFRTQNIAATQGLGEVLRQLRPEDPAAAKSPVVIEPKTDSLIAAYTLLSDIYSRPDFLLRVESDRPVWEQAAKTVDYLLIFGIASVVAFSIVIIALLERVILSRLAKLSAGVKRIESTGDLRYRIQVSGRDELAMLADSINAAMVGLQDSQREIKESEEKFRSISESAQDAIFMLDSGGHIHYWNKAAEKIFRISLHDVMDREFYSLVVPNQFHDSWKKQVEALQDESRGYSVGKTFESSATRKGGRQFPIEVSLSAVKLEGEWHTIGIVRDISERRAMKVIRHMASHDALTDLPNRILFLDRLRQAMAHSRRTGKAIAVLFLDLDHFKDVNDTMGHPFGDELLKAVAERLSWVVREDDTIARLGGDEFAIVGTDLKHAGEAGEFADRVITTLSEPFTIQEQRVYTSPSIGIVTYPTEADDGAGEPEQMLKRADIAMYQAKGKGRKTFEFYDHEMSIQAQARMALVGDLRRAIEKQEFVLHYQPQVDLGTGQILAVEALIRWQHPERGMVPPLDFIPLAEASGAIIQIGEWVIKEACRQAKEWRDSGVGELRVAVNLSAMQVRRSDVVATAAAALDQSGLSSDFLELEITESMVMENTQKTETMVHQLKDLGIRLSIDDFGTGYSSLAYLRRFPVDTLKVDRSFIIDVDKKPDAGHIVKAVIELGHSLGMTVLAEGAETRGELEFLDTMGCDEVQGYYVSKPLPADVLSKWLVEEYDPGTIAGAGNATDRSGVISSFNPQ